MRPNATGAELAPHTFVVFGIATKEERKCAFESEVGKRDDGQAPNTQTPALAGDVTELRFECDDSFEAHWFGVRHGINVELSIY